VCFKDPERQVGSRCRHRRTEQPLEQVPVYLPTRLQHSHTDLDRQRDRSHDFNKLQRSHLDPRRPAPRPQGTAAQGSKSTQTPQQVPGIQEIAAQAYKKSEEARRHVLRPQETTTGEELSSIPLPGGGRSRPIPSPFERASQPLYTLEIMVSPSQYPPECNTSTTRIIAAKKRELTWCAVGVDGRITHQCPCIKIVQSRYC